METRGGDKDENDGEGDFYDQLSTLKTNVTFNIQSISSMKLFFLAFFAWDFSVDACQNTPGKTKLSILTLR